MRNFSGKVAASTGAGSGRGRSLAVELARRGCHLALGDVNERGLAQTAAICAAHGVKITSQRLDVASRAAVFAWARPPRDARRDRCAARAKRKTRLDRPGFFVDAPIAHHRSRTQRESRRSAQNCHHDFFEPGRAWPVTYGLSGNVEASTRFVSSASCG